MKTCRDCIHEKLCVIKAYPDAFENTQWNKEPCNHFKDKSLVLDLPCKVGSKIYQLDTAGVIYESEITTIIFDTTGIAFDLNAIGKNVFLSREAAEQALKEREQG